MKPLIIIPARKGSKRLPGKNTRLLNGIPLVKYTIDYAKQFDYDICVTTDDIQVWEIAVKAGLKPLLRPDNLCTDSSKMEDVLEHAFKHYPNHDYIILLQPTSPFRSAAHLHKAIELFESNDTYPLKSINQRGELNGSIFIYSKEHLRYNKCFQPMSMDDFYSLDIDTPFDWFIAEKLAEYFEKQKIVWTGCEIPA